MNELETALREAAAALPDPSPELSGVLVERAGKEGLVDVAYAVVDSPLGPLTVAGTERGLARVGYGPTDEVLERIAARLSPRVLEAPARLDEARRELEEYFEGRRHDFELPLDWSLIREGFGRRVLKATAAIPFGEVSTYRGVATEAGNERAVRAAGNALGANPLPVVVPCHRVLRTGGGLGGYTGGLDRKEHLLRLEGVLA
jgi:methylated-DNA-[protein]-cysteine S-methyltransferase